MANTQTAEGFSDWRGTPATAVSAVPNYQSWDSMMNSDWNIARYNNSNARMIYNVPLLPHEGQGSLASVAAGEHDDVWRAIAKSLVAHGRSDAILRIGQEANGPEWFRWGATAETASDYVAAYRHVAQVMTSVSPDFVKNFDISAGHALAGGTNKMDALTKLYPGDDVVDVVGVDHYDMWEIAAKTDAEWDYALSPKYGPGLADVVNFAQEHGKKFSVPEWGVVSQQAHGNGDNPFFVQKMAQFMASNKDSLMFEMYFDEVAATQSALYTQDLNPQSAEEYTKKY